MFPATSPAAIDEEYVQGKDIVHHETKVKLKKFKVKYYMTRTVLASLDQVHDGQYPLRHVSRHMLTDFAVLPAERRRTHNGTVVFPLEPC